MTVLSSWIRRGAVARRRRSPATRPDARNKGIRYPADPPTVEEIVAGMRHAADDRHGWRVRAMIVVLWRAGLRVQEALALAEHDLDHRRGSLRIRNGEGGRRRELGMDEWGWEQLRPWLGARAGLPVGPLFCIIDGPTRGRPWSSAAVRSEFRRLATRAGVRRRFAPHQLRHAHALELAREGVALTIIQRQLGHANLGYALRNQDRHRAPKTTADRPRRARWALLRTRALASESRGGGETLCHGRLIAALAVRPFKLFRARTQSGPPERAALIASLRSDSQQPRMTSRPALGYQSTVPFGCICCARA